ncbi:primosomal protein N' [Pontivivens insulae]|uniref:Replication restart protein PriA n=1 Tax=Pontivivens insulae TaxID=1639689 RepID=A0A2R8AF13_9RHOB|nr:primosomal protein N' [Pontivivens insulae]RED12078.1 replication restart DNA helicase PriA [Pontivivens insulae]SPF30834.1 Primosomal protein N' [Pontivivens insulae]
MNADVEFLEEGALAAVLTTQPLDRTLDYVVPDGGVRIGAFVSVPLGPRRVMGVVWGPGAGDYDRSKIRSIAAILDLPAMSAVMRNFVEKVAAYTMTPLPAVLRLATRVPGLGEAPGTRKVLRLTDVRPDRLTSARERVLAFLEEHEGMAFAPGELASLVGVTSSVIKGLEGQGVLVREEAPRDAPFLPLDPDLPGKELAEGQRRAAVQLREAVRSRRYGTTLLKGVTGSGKTEVYLEAVAECLRAGRQALVLLPEIALTGEFIARVEARFGQAPAEWHSGVTQAGRRRVWAGVANGQAQLVVGARSSLFLPYADLGLVIVDEEHDGSYKQEDGVLYNARDMAVLRASLSGAQVVLASATPSLESWANADAGKYARIDLTERFGAAVLPEMAAIDLRADPLERERWMSEPLARAVADRVAAGEQALLFLNRRGYAPLTMCRACGAQVGCDDCDARMVEHRFHAHLMCHQCGATKPIPTSCPSCGNPDHMAVLGPGVERLAEEVAARFPDARVAVLSSDMAMSARALKARIEEIAKGAADIIIGTQMVAKGHNFPLLTLVGVIDADLGLQGGELRAAERTFQLIRQVAGRAGRADRPGEALIQTHQPDHPVIKAILSDDEEAFWRAEAASRQMAGAPPYGRMAGVIVSGPEERETFELARQLAARARILTDAGAQMFGPAPAPIARVRGRTRVRLLVKGPKGLALQPVLARWVDGVRPRANFRIALDIDPQSFF